MAEQNEQLMMKFQMLEMNLNAVRKKYEEVLRKTEEIEVTRATIEELRHVRPSPAMIPIGSNNFLAGKIDDTESIIVGIGGGVALKKKRDEAIRILSERVKELDAVTNELANDEQGIIRELQRLQPEMEKMTKGK